MNKPIKSDVVERALGTRAAWTTKGYLMIAGTVIVGSTNPMVARGVAQMTAFRIPSGRRPTAPLAAYPWSCRGLDYADIDYRYL